MLVVAVVVVAVAGFCVYRLHGMFGSTPRSAADATASNDIVAFNPKQVVLEVFGPPGAVATITYLDANAQPQLVDNTTLPWSHEITTTQPAISANVVAQGDGDFIGCRIIVNGEVTEEKSVNQDSAYTYCLDKSA